MSAADLKLEVLELLGDVRSAGRGASRTVLGLICDERLPGLIASHDEYREARMSEHFMQRLSATVTAACAEIRVAGNVITLPPPASKTPRFKWAWRLALAAAVLLAAILAYRVLLPKDEYLAPRVEPRSVAPKAPLPPRRNPAPADAVVHNHESPHRPTRPDRRRVAIREQPIIGAFAASPTDVTLREGAGTVAAREGLRIRAGAVIETGDMGRAQIRLADGSKLDLGFNTEVVAEQGGGRHFTLRRGSLFVMVVHTADNGRFTVETPVAAAQVLGTEFGLRLERVHSKLQALLQVKSGLVHFYNDRGGVDAGKMTEATAVEGSKPTGPRRIGTLRIFSFDWTKEKIERRGLQLTEEAAAHCYVYPLGTTGFFAAAVANGDLQIVSLTQDASARMAGLRVGDAIVAVDGRRPTMDSLDRGIFQRAGQILQLTIRREGTDFDVAVPVVFDDPVARILPNEVASRLFEATRPALEGDRETALSELGELAEEMPHPAVYNNLGVVFESFDRMPEAIRSYRAAVRLDPKDPKYHRNLARALENIGNVERAVDLLEEAVNDNPEDTGATFALAEAYRLVDRPGDSLALIEQATTRLPTSADVWIAWSEALMHAGKPDEAIEAATQATRVLPDCARAFFTLGLVLNLRGRYEEAEGALARAIDLNPCEPTFYNSRGINFKDMGRTQEAEAAFRKCLTLDADFVPGLTGLGGLLLDTGRFAEAEAMLNQAVQLDASNASARYFLGCALWKLGRSAEAESTLRTAVGLNPADADIAWTLAALLNSLGKFKEEMAAWEAAISAAPREPELFSSLGWAQIENHRWAQAVVSLRRSLEIDRKHEHRLSVLKNLGFALIHLGRLPEAEVALSEALRIRPDDPEASSNWALLLAHKDDKLEEALELARKAATPGSYAQRFYCLGFVQLKRGEYDEAIASLKTAAEGFGKTYLAADALVLLGQAYEGKNDRASAIDTYRRALAIEPGNATAAQAAKRLGP